MATLFTLALSSCANSPSHLIIAPELNMPAVMNYHDQQVQFHVTDLRTAKHIIQILHEGEAAELMTSQVVLTEIIQKTLVEEFSKQGLDINQSADNNIDVIIDKALINVKQDLMSYQAVSNISLRIKVKNTQQTLTKTFNSKSTSTGPLSADVAVLERDFNQQLSNALINILTNKEISQFIK